MRIATVAGARPQFIKAAVVSRALKKLQGISEFIIHTGQHYDENMSRIFFDEMNIDEPMYNLGIKESMHGAMTGAMLTGIEKVLMNEKPDYVLVYGDTNTTLAGAIAACKLHIPVAHVEAGLRSYNRRMPEEINRILTDNISTLLFCPAQKAVDNLRHEGFDKGPHSIHCVGDVMYDAALYYSSLPGNDILERLNIKGENFLLCTVHRAENTNDILRLKNIIAALNTLHASVPVILPLHPRTKAVLTKENIEIDFHIIDPVGYPDMLQLLKHCSLVITDSGGLQKEAFYFDKYCVILRDETEWVELVENKYCFLAGSSTTFIVDAVMAYADKKIPAPLKLYGAGNAGELIADILLKQNG